MSEQQHTPGPWASVDWSVDLSPHGSKTVCVTIIGGDRESIVADNVRACDAPLIAAAPETAAKLAAREADLKETGEAYLRVNALRNKAEAKLAACEAELDIEQRAKKHWKKSALSAEAERDRLKEQVAELVEAVRRADQFITNGLDFGYIRLPEDPDDSAHETPGFVAAALAKNRAEGK